MGSEQHAAPIDEQETLERETRARWKPMRPSFNAWAVESGEPLSAFDEIVEGQIRHARVKYQKERASNELEQDSVLWNQVTPEDVASLEEKLASDPDESAMHCFLENNPKFLVQALSGGHGRYQLSKPRLGGEYVPDFLVAQMSSIGLEWFAVELESPKKEAHRQDGLQTSDLTQAIGQIRNWRSWLMNNIGYARRPEEQDGLGLIGIDNRVPGLILIGRRHESHPDYNEFRRQMIDRERIVIHSYDWLVEVARKQLEWVVTRKRDS